MRKNRAMRALFIVAVTGLLLTQAGCGGSIQTKEEARGAADLTEMELSGEETAEGTNAGAGSDTTLFDGTKWGTGAFKEGNASQDNAGFAADETHPIGVYVCGAVEKPGVYFLPENARVKDAIDLAGGLTEDAEERLINQAAYVTDGMQITVPTKEEAGTVSFTEEGSLVSSASGGTGKININTATKEELMTLSGIGEARASSIVAYRQMHGAFSSIEELQNISGIKGAVFEKIKDFIEV